MDKQHQLETWTSDDFNDYLVRETLKYPTQYERSIRNILRCGKFFLVQKCEADPTHHTTKHPWSCGIRYCSQPDDVKLRYVRIHDRLKHQTNKVKSPRLYHFTIGSNQLGESLESTESTLTPKQQLDKYLAAFFRNLRRGSKRAGRPAFKLVYVKVLDVNKTGYWHYHIALLPETNLRNVDKFMRICKAALRQIDSRLVFNNIGWRSKKQVLSYMAKRGAGILGHHKEGYYYLNDLMSPLDYFKSYYRSKNVSYHLPEWLVNTIVTCPAKSPCPVCKYNMIFHSYEYIGGHTDGKPPPS